MLLKAALLVLVASVRSVAADQCTGGKFPVSPVVVEIHCAECANKVASVVPKTVCVPCASAAAIDCKQVEVCYDKDKKKFPCARTGEGAHAMAYFTKQIFKNCLCTKEQHLSGAAARESAGSELTMQVAQKMHGGDEKDAAALVLTKVNAVAAAKAAAKGATTAAKAPPVATTTAPPPKRKKHKKKAAAKGKAAPLRVGSAVEGNWQNAGDWYAGKITAASGDGTFTVTYNDGDVEKGLTAALIRRPKAPSKAPPTQQPAATSTTSTTAAPTTTTTAAAAAPTTTTSTSTTSTSTSTTSSTTTSTPTIPASAPTMTTTTAASTTTAAALATTTAAAPATAGAKKTAKAKKAKKAAAASKGFAVGEQVVATANERMWHLARVTEALSPVAYVVQFGDGSGEPIGDPVHVAKTHIMKLTETTNKLVGTAVFGASNGKKEKKKKKKETAAKKGGALASATKEDHAAPSRRHGQLECPSGMVLSAALIKGAAQECLACPDGTWAAKGASECAFKSSQVCKAGEFFDGNPGGARRLSGKAADANSACTNCPHGKFAAAGDNICTACAKGFVTTTAGAKQVSECKRFSCPAGKFKAMSTYLKRYGCHPCPSGRYGVTVNADGPVEAQRAKCLDCPAGRTTHKYGETICTATKPPTPAPTASTPTPKPTPGALVCPPGKFEAVSTILRKHGCHHCPAGKFGNPLQAHGHPLPPHAKACVTCPKGKWQPFYGKKFCHRRTKTLSKIMKEKGYKPTPAPTDAVTHKVVVGKTTKQATLKHECDCSPQYEASEFLRCVIDEDGKHVHEVSLPFAAHLMAKNAGEYSDDHICSVVGETCRCCVCDDKNEPSNIDSLGTGWYWIAPPFLAGNHVDAYDAAKSLQECEQKCAEAPGCVTGTYVTTFEGEGQCWLATKALKFGEKCVEQCESFVKRTKDPDDQLKETALAKWYRAFHQGGESK